tara:strand:- start:13147 stop:13491 length:345 start_codon:yes stop_codon:yes gene_type:complete
MDKEAIGKLVDDLMAQQKEKLAISFENLKYQKKGFEDEKKKIAGQIKKKNLEINNLQRVICEKNIALKKLREKVKMLISKRLSDSEKFQKIDKAIEQQYGKSAVDKIHSYARKF